MSCIIFVQHNHPLFWYESWSTYTIDSSLDIHRSGLFILNKFTAGNLSTYLPTLFFMRIRILKQHLPNFFLIFSHLYEGVRGIGWPVHDGQVATGQHFHLHFPRHPAAGPAALLHQAETVARSRSGFFPLGVWSKNMCAKLNSMKLPTGTTASYSAFFNFIFYYHVT